MTRSKEIHDAYMKGRRDVIKELLNIKDFKKILNEKPREKV